MNLSTSSIDLGSLDPTWATFLLALAVLGAGVFLIVQALKAGNSENAKLVFTSVGVLFGLLAAGGIGTLFAKQASEGAENAAVGAATKTAAKVAPSAANAAANQVSEEVTEQVQKALEASPEQANGGAAGEGSKQEKP